MFPQSFRCCLLKVAVGTGLIVLLSPLFIAAQPAATDSVMAEIGLSPAPAIKADTLIIQNRPIAVFRADMMGHSPEKRVQKMRERIAELLAAGGTYDVAALPIPQGMLIQMGGNGVFVISFADLDSLAGETLEEVSKRTVDNLTLALKAELEQRSLKYMLTAVALTVLATIIFLVILAGIRRGHRYFYKLLEELARRGISKVNVSGVELIDANRQLALVRRLADLLAWVAALFMTYIWLTFSLRRFPYTRPWGDSLRSYMLSLLQEFALAIVDAIPGLVAVILIFFITRLLIRFIKTFFTGIETGRISLPWVHAETAQTTRRMVVFVIWLFALVLAYPYLPGSDSAAFKGLSVFVGLMLSIGSSGVVNQAMSGLILIYSRALKTGDYVRIGDVEGIVLSQGILSTKIKTIKREEITIPNSVILSTDVKNYSRLAGSEGVIIYTSVTIGYSVPWRQVHALLIMAADRTPGLRKQPPPFVGQVALSDFYVEYQINAYLEQPEKRLPTLAALHANIQDTFNEYGVQILSPHYEADPPAPVWVPKEKWYESPAQNLNPPANKSEKLLKPRRKTKNGEK